MSTASKAAGTRWETNVVRYLAGHWPDVTRRVLAGRFDKGDILNGPQGWTIECKAEARINLPQYMREAKAEAEHSGNPWYAAVVKNRRGTLSTGKVQDAFVVMPLHLFADYADEHEAMFNRLEALGETT